eukprot:5805210-Prymnesium_polylepis.1
MNTCNTYFFLRSAYWRGRVPNEDDRCACNPWALRDDEQTSRDTRDTVKVPYAYPFWNAH